MLARLRDRARQVTTPIAKRLAGLGVTPNMLTLIGLALALLCPILALLKDPLLVCLLMLASALMDALDGALARVTGSTSRVGELLDSTTDRVSDGAYIISLLLLGYEPVLVTLVLLSSLLVSYVRAKAEPLGVRLEGVGVAERGDRVLMFTLVLLAHKVLGLDAAMIVLYVVLALILVTFIMRLYVAIKSLRG